MSAPAELLHSAFYRFCPLSDPQAAAATLRALGARWPRLGGALIVAREGLNGAVAGPAEAVRAFEAALSAPAALGAAADRLALAGLGFKHTQVPRQLTPFGRFKVSVKPEIVALHLPAADAAPPPDERDASHLDPAAWRALLDSRPDLVLIDNRNHFEYRLGRFAGAIDPAVANFRDFGAWLQAQAPRWRAQGRPVAMYCTGGIRCDKTAPWMRSLGLQVWQLDGGILHYLASLDSAQRSAERHWQGAVGVFDERLALDAALRPLPDLAPEQVYNPQQPDEAWRLKRARELRAAASQRGQWAPGMAGMAGTAGPATPAPQTTGCGNDGGGHAAAG